MTRRVLMLTLAGGMLLALASCGGQPEPGAPATVRGAATTPIEDTFVFAYREDMDIYGPAFASAGPTGPDGGYDLSLPPGRYLFVARRRGTGEAGGPVKTGDYRSDTVGPIEVRAGETLDLDFLVSRKLGESKTLPARAENESRTGLSGTIRDSEGNPVPGARVHVYTYVQMSERPKYVSNETGPDGGYIILLPQGGTYYLAARNQFGGPPKLGDLYGRYDDGTIDPSAVVVHDGEILEGVDITVHKVW